MVDVVESVRLMERDEEDTILRWRSFAREVLTKVLPSYGGRFVKSTGDGMVLEFEAVFPAIRCTLAMHSQVAQANTARSMDARMFLRAGVHVGDVYVDEMDIQGRAVNLAARLMGEAGPGEIVVSAAVRDQLVDSLDVDVEDMGDRYLKHLAEPVRAYRIATLPDIAAWEPTRPVQSLRPVIAVIPFEARDSAGLSPLIGDALADEVIATLSRSPELTVISRLSTAAFRGWADALQAMRSRLHADYVLTGSLFIDGDRVRLVAQMTEARSAQVVWSRNLVGGLRGVFIGDDPMVDDLAQLLCEALARRQIERARREPMATLESYCLLMSAIAILHATSWSDFEQARRMLEHLVERDRRHPAPHAWLAKWHVMRVQQGWSQNRDRDRQLALDCTRRALDIDPKSSLSLAIDGFVHCNLMKDLDGANQRYQVALAENPNEPLAWLFLGTLHAFRGEGTQALDAAERALKLSPLDPMRYFFESLTATAALSAGHYERAVEHAKRSLKLNRNHTSTLRALAIAQVQLGRLDEAHQTAGELLRLEPGLTIREYLARTPSSGFETGVLWSESLAAAGVPRG